MSELLDVIRRHKVYDLAQPYFVGMPHFPTHPPYLFGLTRKHGDMLLEGKVSSSAEAIALGGFSELSVDTIAPILRRGVLLDIAAEMKPETQSDALPADFAITPEHLEQALKTADTTVEPGDVVLLRTGWARFFPEASRHVTGSQVGHAVTGPSPELDAARWLSERGVFAAGSDTIAFEKVPAVPLKIRGGTGALMRPLALA